MVLPIPREVVTLTGRARTRRGRFGRYVLEVEEWCRVYTWDDRPINEYKRWRDAKQTDYLNGRIMTFVPPDY